MRTIKLKLYSFDELSKEAKQKALENYVHSAEYFWGDDAIKSLEGFCKHFECSLKKYSIDWLEGYRNEYSFYIPEHMRNLSEEEMGEYIESMGSYDKETLKGTGECKFTGYCADEDAADGARKAYFEGERNIDEILGTGFESWYSACKSDFEYQLTEEYYSEHCEANEYEFYENGEMHR